MCGAMAGAGTPLSAQQLGYTLAPTATRISWDDNLPLQDDWMYGGRLSLVFGSQVELQPFFLRGNRFGVDSARGASVFGAGSLNRSLRVDHMGANVQLNLGTGDLMPFVRAGGGLLKLDPDSGATTRRLTIAAGAGLRLNLGGVSGEIFAEQFRFRMVPGRLFGGDTVPLANGEKAPILRNMSYGAALNIPLSVLDDDSQSSGLRGTRAPLELFVGRLAFDDAMGLADQDLMGARTGLDFGSQVGLRGYYMRGVNKDHDRTAPISSYGGEAQFNLNDGRGVTPYVVLGAGRIDYLKDYRDLAGNPRDDETALIVGGGASFGLTDHVKVNVAIRDMVTTRSEQLSTTGDPDDLLHNRLLSAGLTLSFGGSSSGDRERERVRERDRERMMRERDEDIRMERSARSGRRTGETQRAMERREAAEERMMRGDSTMRMRDRDGMVRINEKDSVRVLAPDGSGRMLMIPVPAVGEIIIRYGTPTGSAPMHMDMRVRDSAMMDPARMIRHVDTVRVERVDTVRRTPPDMRGNMTVRSGADSARLDALERQLTETRNELERVRRERAGDRVVERALTPEPTSRYDGNGGNGVAFFSRLLAVRPADITPFVGLSTGDGTQFVVSARMDLGALRPSSPVDLVPELSLAVGDGRTTVMGMANLRYTLGVPGGVHPYLMVGGGVSNDTFLVLGTSVGVSANLRSSSSSPLYGFAEVQGINLFNQTRLMVGMSLRR